ncbi:MAG TPA: NAD(P)H-dependent glycerol-3-phosphate dehydrogenase [Planktothrix sp.]
MTQICILGAGSWGATLGVALRQAGNQVTFWTQDAGKAALINRDRRIEKPIAVEFPDGTIATDDIVEATRGAEFILFCCPSQAVRAVAYRLEGANLDAREKKPVLVSAVKGLELTTLRRISEVLSEILPDLTVAALSGPNLASEILAGLPAAAVIGCPSLDTAASVQKALATPNLRLYSNADITGVELGGTLKNVIAIAAGVSDGLRLGANAKAALLTRGLAEITRMAVKLGAKPQTMAGLAGMGDLLATCAGPTSRNYKLGMELAKGRKAEQILQEMGVAVEGVPTAQAVCELSKKLGLELPIAEQVEATLKGKSSPEQAIMTLMKRPLASE